MRQIIEKNYVDSNDDNVKVKGLGEVNDEGYIEGKGLFIYDNGYFQMGEFSNGWLNGFGVKFYNDPCLYVGVFSGGKPNGITLLDERHNSFRFGVHNQDGANGLNFRILHSKDWLVCKYSEDHRVGKGLLYLSFFKQLFEVEFLDDSITKIKSICDDVNMDNGLQSLDFSTYQQALKDNYPHTFEKIEWEKSETCAQGERWVSKADNSIGFYQWTTNEYHINFVKGGCRKGLGMAKWQGGKVYFSNFDNEKCHGTTVTFNANNPSVAALEYQQNDVAEGMKFIVREKQAIAYNPDENFGVLFNEDGTYQFIKDLDGNVLGYSYDTVSKDKVCKTKTVDSVNEVLKKPTVKKSLDTLDDLSGKKMVNIPIGDYCVMQAKTFKSDVDEGQTNTGISHYLAFVGNPGTGKKYVAKLLGEIYHSFGILSKGHIVEVNGRELLGRCEGDTVRKLNQTIWKAQGGVLYIDEAYVLESQDDDGWDCEDEAVETLIRAMEECKGDIIVILAGNKNKLQSFIYSVSELRSRFRNFIDFEDYSGEELNEIFKRILKENDYNIEEDALCVLERYLNNKKMNRFTKNSEDVYDLFEEIIGFQKRRVAKADNLSQEDSATIMVEDLPYSIE